MKNVIKQMAGVLVAATVITANCFSAGAATLKTENGIKYIQQDDGETKVYTGWVKKAGKRYYYKDGIMKKSCWLKSKGKRTYFLRKDGSMATGKVTISGVEYEFGEDGKLIPESWGLTLTAKDITPEGMKLEILWNGTETGGEIDFGSYFHLEQYKNGKWTEVSFKDGSEDVCFTDEAYILTANVTAGQTIKWEHIYGELKSGKYRYCTEFMNYRGPGDYDKKMYYAYFKI